jgi:hypothetical protein
MGEGVVWWRVRVWWWGGMGEGERRWWVMGEGVWVWGVMGGMVEVEVRERV